jgi:hypothetical protein
MLNSGNIHYEIADPTTAGDFCRRFSSEQVQMLQDIINETRLKVRHEHQKQTLLRMEFKKFRTYFVMLPCQIVKTGRRLLYRLLGWNDYLDVFFRALDSFCRPLRCPRPGPKDCPYSDSQPAPKGNFGF